MNKRYMRTVLTNAQLIGDVQGHVEELQDEEQHEGELTAFTEEITNSDVSTKKTTSAVPGRVLEFKFWKLTNNRLTAR